MTKPHSRAIFTICSNNYLPMAHVLLQSARMHHPEADVYLCLADEKLSDEGLYAGDFEMVTADALRIPDFREFAFRYGIMEFNTAVKPFMFQHLLARGHTQVVYLDPDIEVMAPLDHVFQLLDDGASFVLTPHLTQPAERDTFPDDTGIMRAGVYNLGFLGVGACDEAERIVAWWARRLQYECVSEPERGIFVDQKFMDLVPGFAADARILRETGYNLAYWNLFQRKLGKFSKQWVVDGERLRFVHFSGIDPANLQRLSKHTTAFGSDEISPELAELMQSYARKVLDNGHGRVPAATYAYARFASGTRIHERVRQMFRDQHLCWAGGDPFETYEEYLQMPTTQAATCGAGYVTRLMAHLHQREAWLRHTFDLNTRAGVAGYIDWYIHHGRSMVGDTRLVEPVQLRATRTADSVQIQGELIATPATLPELTVVGYLQVASGVGEAGRQMLRSLGHAGFRTTGMPIRVSAMPMTTDFDQERLFDETVAARVQVFHVNADQLSIVMGELANKLPTNSWRAVVPFWELEHFPEPWLAAFNQVDEVWAPTRFIQKMLARRVGKPVVHMPLQLTFDVPPSVGRAQFDLPDGAFLFFFAFDFLSYVGRKNPMAVLRAFRQAFVASGARANVRLVVKTLNLDKAGVHNQALCEELRNNPDVVLVDETMTREQTLQLIDCCDAVVSLHRSEGLGLLLAEAMQLGKPVIATDYSATTELLSEKTGWPVDFKLVPVPDGDYPFHQGQVWAEPDEVHAAWQMRQVFHQRAEAARRAGVAREMLETHFGADATAARLRSRLGRIMVVNSSDHKGLHADQ